VAHISLVFREMWETTAPNLQLCLATDSVGSRSLNPTSREKRAGCPDFLYAALATTAYAPFVKEGRAKFAESTNPDRKSRMWATRRFVFRREYGEE
jgi:hypothetical protein